MVGRTCRLEPLTPAHSDDLWAAVQLDPGGQNWTYSAAAHPPDRQAFDAFIGGSSASNDPLYFAIVEATSSQAVGWATFMRIDPKNGVIEVGSIHYTERLKRSVAGTEAMYLMMRRAFDDLGYRRYEWKCDDLNAPSKRAAARYGFTYEGLFRQALVNKGRNRDTAWFSVIDSEWPSVKAGFETWLAPGNFDADGRQIASLVDLRSRGCSGVQRI